LRLQNSDCSHPIVKFAYGGVNPTDTNNRQEPGIEYGLFRAPKKKVKLAPKPERLNRK